MLSSTLSAPTFCPIRLDIGGLVRILESFVPVLKRSVCAGSIGIKDMVCWVKFDGLREFVTTRMSACHRSQGKIGSYTAVVKSLAANALLPSALRASAMFAIGQLSLLSFVVCCARIDDGLQRFERHNIRCESHTSCKRMLAKKYLVVGSEASRNRS